MVCKQTPLFIDTLLGTVYTAPDGICTHSATVSLSTNGNRKLKRFYLKKGLHCNIGGKICGGHNGKSPCNLSKMWVENEYRCRE